MADTPYLEKDVEDADVEQIASRVADLLEARQVERLRLATEQYERERPVRQFDTLRREIARTRSQVDKSLIVAAFGVYASLLTLIALQQIRQNLPRK